MADWTTEAPREDQAPEQTEEDEFREEQRRLAAVQGATDENAVPETRPVASQLPGASESDLTRRMREAGELNTDPMPKSAFDRASSDEQMDKAREESRQEAIAVGNAVEVIDEDSPHFRRRGAVVRAIYDEDDYAKRSGQPEQRFIHAQELEVTARGDTRDGETLLLKPEQLKVISAHELTPPRAIA